MADTKEHDAVDAPADNLSPPSDSAARDGKPDGKKESARPSLLKRPVIRIGLLSGLCIAVVAGGVWMAHYMSTGRYLEATDDAYFRTDSVTVAPKVSGYVEEVLVRDNQDVAKGQPLVRIDPREYASQSAQSQAQIDVSAANADAARAQIKEQEASIAQARAKLAAAQASADFAQGEAQRFAPLAQTGAETAEAFAGKRNQAKRSALDVNSARAALANAEHHVSTLQAQVRQAQSQGEAAAAQLVSANVNLQSATVVAGLAGRVGDQTVRVGQYVQSGARLMTLVPLDQLYITANFKETQLGRMRRGQPATIQVDALSGVQLHGHVESIAPGTGAEFSLIPPQNATGNFTKIVQRVPVRIVLDAGPETRKVLVPGLSVKVSVDTLSAKDDVKQMQRDEEARRGDHI